MDYNIRLKNGLVLKGIINSPGEDIRAMVILVHGLGEHILRYSHWSDLFARNGIGFTGVDLPGHGRSDGSRGNIKSFSVTDEIIETLIDETRKTFPGLPLFIYGHSLGGGIVIDHLIRKQPAVRGAIITSPWLKLTFEPDRIKLALASFMKNIMPGLVQPSGLVVDHISHDREVVEKYNSDPLVHDRISVSLFHSAMNAAARSLDNAHELKVPVLLMHGSDDLICSPEGSREFASKSKNSELRIWEGGYHELHNEPFKAEVFSYVIKWINKLLS